MKLPITLLLAFACHTICFSQKGLYLSPRITVRNSFTDIINRSIDTRSLPQGSINLGYGLHVGYNFGKLPIGIETGFCRSRYETKMSIYDKNPIGFGFGKPMVFRAPITANEYNATLVWHINHQEGRKFGITTRAGFVFMRNILPSSTTVTGTESRTVDSVEYSFDYTFDSYQGAWAATRLETGFGLDYKINSRLSLNATGSISLGLRHFQVRYFSYYMTIDDKPTADIGNITVVNKGDQIALSFGLQYNLKAKPEQDDKKKKAKKKK